MEIKVNADDLVRWGRMIGELPNYSKLAKVRALNTFGDGVLRETVRTIADKNGWDPDEVASKIVVQRADRNNLTWMMDASLVLAPSQDWNRPWQTREQSEFEQNTLVNIVNVDDDACPICKQAAASGPYTMDQVLQFQAQWAEYVPPTPNIKPGVITNLLHPRCRCISQPWTSTRRLAVTFPTGTSGVGTDVSGTRSVTMQQLARLYNQELLNDIKQLKITGI